jgi:hypothetical protein
VRTNAAVDFEITDEDMEILERIDEIDHYGDASMFPVYGGT